MKEECLSQFDNECHNNDQSQIQAPNDTYNSEVYECLNGQQICEEEE